MNVDVDFMAVDGIKEIPAVSDRRGEFLKTVKEVIEKLRPFWPVSIRQIHYNLLPSPPLKQSPKRSKFRAEHYRYRNDKPSYNSLVDLLRSARYHGQVSMTCIDDPTRPQKTWGGFTSVSEFVEQETWNFLKGYHRDRQQDQPRHIEVFGEKATLMRILEKACGDYYVPFSIGRGFCSIPVWRDIAKRFRDSGKERMTLIIVSDHDPEGLELADDAIRSLALHHVPVDGHRIAVTREQIDSLGLAEDFNPAKEDSTRYDAFVKRTRNTKTWEVEASIPSTSWSRSRPRSRPTWTCKSITRCATKRSGTPSGYARPASKSPSNWTSNNAQIHQDRKPTGQRRPAVILRHDFAISSVAWRAVQELAGRDLGARAIRRRGRAISPRTRACGARPAG